jgi:hypothetical protein
VLPDGRLGVYAPQEGRHLVRVSHPRVGLVRTGEEVEVEPSALRWEDAPISDAVITARVRVLPTQAGDRWQSSRLAGERCALPRRRAVWLQREQTGVYLSEVYVWLLWVSRAPAPDWHQGPDHEAYDVHGCLLVAVPPQETHTIAIYEVPHGG